MKIRPIPNRFDFNRKTHKAEQPKAESAPARLAAAYCEVSEAARRPLSGTPYRIRPVPGRLRIRLRAGGAEALYKREALRSRNPVFKSILPILENSLFVTTDGNKILEIAGTFADANLEPSDWRMPVYIEEDSERTVQFFMLADSINFKFWGKDAKDRFATEYRGKKYDGSMGMVACLKRALDEGVPILDSNYLSKLTVEQARNIFRGNMEIPMLENRVRILNEVGRVLKKKYGGNFYNLYKASKGYAFHNGSGMVELLLRDFPSFRDEAKDPITGETVVFNKRAQLAVAMLASRLKGTGLFNVRDLDNLSVFADYELPKILNNLGIIRYSPELTAKINRGEFIPSGSREEIEIRAHTIYASKLLELALKKLGKKVNALNIDYLLWSQGRNLKDKPHHLTITTDY